MESIRFFLRMKQNSLKYCQLFDFNRWYKQFAIFVPRNDSYKKIEHLIQLEIQYLWILSNAIWEYSSKCNRNKRNFKMFVHFFFRNFWENKNKMDESTRWLFYSILVENDCQLLHFEKVTIIIIIRKKTQL